MTNRFPRRDRIDTATEQWRQHWPELDLSGFGIVARLVLLARHVESDGAETLAAYGLHTGEFDVLSTLRRSGEPFRLTMSTLCRDVLLSSGGMTHRVDRLERRGLVRREADPGDRRSVVVALTAEGRALMERALLAKIEQASLPLSVLSRDEAETLEGLLRKLLGAREGHD